VNDYRGGGRILQWVLFSWLIVAVGEEFCRCQLLFVVVASAAAINKGLLLKRLCRSSTIRVVIMEKL